MVNDLLKGLPFSSACPICPEELPGIIFREALTESLEVVPPFTNAFFCVLSGLLRAAAFCLFFRLLNDLKSSFFLFLSTFYSRGLSSCKIPSSDNLMAELCLIFAIRDHSALATGGGGKTSISRRKGGEFFTLQPLRPFI